MQEPLLGAGQFLLAFDAGFGRLDGLRLPVLMNINDPTRRADETRLIDYAFNQGDAFVGAVRVANAPR